MLSPRFSLALGVSLGLTVVLWLRAAAAIRRTAVDVYGSRLLLQAATVNVVLCSLLAAGSSGVIAWQSIAAGRALAATTVLALACWFLPAKALWDCFTGARRLHKRYGLRPHPSAAFLAGVDSLARMMNVTPPKVASSPVIAGPFLFGRTSTSAVLAVPANWDSIADPLIRGTLLHELAHIRNRDVGFLTWAQAFCRGWAWILLLVALATLLALTGSGSLLGAELRAALFYGVCLVELWLLCKVVTRDRERLADRTVALLLANSELGAAEMRQILAAPRRSHDSLSNPWTHRLRDRLINWLADKALFGRRHRFWAAALRLFRFLQATHPSSSARTAPALADANRAGSLSNSLLLSESIWMGMVLGTLSAAMALLGSMLEHPWFGIADASRPFDFTMDLMSTAIVPVAGVVAMRFVLPAWASLRVALPQARFVALLFGRYAVCLATAMITSSGLAFAGAVSPQTGEIAAVAAAWCLLVMPTSLAINLVLLALGLATRYLSRGFRVDFLYATPLIGPGMLAPAVLFLAALVWLLPERPVTATMVVMSGLAGLVGQQLFMSRTAFCGNDQFAVLRLAQWQHFLEGFQARRRGLWLLSAVTAGGICLPGMVCFGVLYLATRMRQPPASAEFLLSVLLLSGLASLVLLFKINRPWSDSQLLRRRLTLSCLLRRIRSVAGGVVKAGSTPVVHAQIAPRIERAPDCMEELYEWSRLLEQNAGSSRWLSVCAEWALSCETQAGFGLWPGSSPRLSASVFALEILHAARRSANQPPMAHGQWIRRCQDDGGWFQGPWSRRSRLQDTFFAVRSLHLLNQPMDPAAKAKCVAWVRHDILDKHREDCSEAPYYGLSILACLGELTEEDLRPVRTWSRFVLHRYALTNVFFNVESLSELIQVLQMCFSPHELQRGWGDLLDTLALRVETALAAEPEPGPCPFLGALLDPSDRQHPQLAPI